MCLGVLTFALVAFTGLLWALYIRMVGRRPLLAGGLDALLFLTGALVVQNYTDNGWLAFPGAAGAFVGTVLGSLLSRER